jgi:hypothetical protein
MILQNLVSHTTLCDNVCQWLVAGQVLSQGTSVSSNNKTADYTYSLCHHYKSQIKCMRNGNYSSCFINSKVTNWIWCNLSKNNFSFVSHVLMKDKSRTSYGDLTFLFLHTNQRININYFKSFWYNMYVIHGWLSLFFLEKWMGNEMMGLLPTMIYIWQI